MLRPAIFAHLNQLCVDHNGLTLGKIEAGRFELHGDPRRGRNERQFGAVARRRVPYGDGLGVHRANQGIPALGDV
jgi:hypothetical protein